MLRFIFIFISFIIALFAKPIVSVSIPPQAYFLKQIAQDTITIHTLLPQNIDPHTFEFKPQMLYALQKSDLYLTIGLEFEEVWLPKLKDNLARTKILSITQNIPFLPLQDSHHHGNDPHIWLSPSLVKILAQNITLILSTHYPEHKDFYEKNLKSFLKQITVLHQNITDKLKSLKNRNFLSYHPSWAYFAKDFHLQEFCIEVEGKEPTPQELAKTINLAKQHRIKTIFVQNGFSAKSALIIAQSCGAKTWVSNPLSYEWEKELLNLADGLLQ